jgi:hypothetical protein
MMNIFKRTKRCLLMAFFIGLSLLTAVPAGAANKYWIGDESGFWHSVSSWSPTGQPLSGDTVYLTQSDAKNREVQYYNTAYPAAVLTSLTIDATGSGTMRLYQSYNHPLSAGYEVIGLYGTGTFQQTTGTNTVTTSLALGSYSGSSGTYNLSGGALSASNEYLGQYGKGTFTQTGGTNSLSQNLWLGYHTGGIGNYVLSGSGSLSAAYEVIGYNGTGTFTQTGGTNTLTNNLVVGEGVGSVSSYTLSGGNLSAGAEYIGWSGIGTFTHTGGTNTVTNNLYLGHDAGSSGTYTLSGGTLDVRGGIAGGLGTSTLNLNGGTLSNNWQSIHVDTLNLGYDQTAAFIQTGSRTVLVNNDLNLGVVSSGSGTYTLYSGTLDVRGRIRSGSGSGAFIINGGTLLNNWQSIDVYNVTIGSWVGANGTFTMDSKSVTSYNMRIGYSGTGALTQTGGTNMVGSNLILGYSSGASGAYALSGAGSFLDSREEYVGYDGTGTFTQTGGTNTAANGLILGYSSGSSGTYHLSGAGVLSSRTESIGPYGIGTFNQSGGTNTVTMGLELGSHTGSIGTYHLSGGSLSANSEYIGYLGTGTFTQTGGTNTVTNILTIAVQPGSAGAYQLSGGTLTAGGIVNNDAFTQSGGTLNGDLQNNGTFTYSGGSFAKRLANYGTAVFNADFAAGDGMANYSSVAVPTNRTVTLNGTGLDNQGTINMYGGTLSGGGLLTNNGSITGYGTIQGLNGFNNNGYLTQSSGDLVLTGSVNRNDGNINLASGRFLTLSGPVWVNLNNFGNINLNNAIVRGETGSLINWAGGMIFGNGVIASNFENRGVVVVNNGITRIANAFNNSGLLQLTSYTANLAGGVITNTGSIEGNGNIGNVIANTGIIDAIGGTLSLGGITNNNMGGLMTASTGNKLLVTQGMATNAGIINLTGGTFDNNNHVMNNAGQVSGYGTFRTGGLSNTGTITLTGTNGSTTTVNGSVINDVAGRMEVAHNPAIFTGNVTNYGTFKTTQTNVTFAGTFTNDGAYISDPATNYFHALSIGANGYMQGGLGDNFFIETDLINSSTQNTLWNTNQALLGFIGNNAHQFYLAGADLGANMSGFTNNFSWETLIVEGTVNLVDGDATTGGAQYVNAILGAVLAGTTITNIYGQDGFNIYYLASAQGNGYLNGLTYNFTDGGQLIPVGNVPLPPAVWLLGTGLAGLFVRRRFVK